MGGALRPNVLCVVIGLRVKPDRGGQCVVFLGKILLSICLSPPRYHELHEET